MVIKENELMTVPYTASFEEKFIIEDDMNFLLNNISIYGCVNDNSFNKVNFDIRVINDKKVIYPLDDYKSYFLYGKRLVKATRVEIKASDYIDKVEHNGDFIFIIKGNDNEQKQTKTSS